MTADTSTPTGNDATAPESTQTANAEAPAQVTQVKRAAPPASPALPAVAESRHATAKPAPKSAPAKAKKKAPRSPASRSAKGADLPPLPFDVTAAMKLAGQEVERAHDALLKGYDELSSLGKDTVEAYWRSGAVVTKGAQTLGKEMVSYAQLALESNAAAAKAVIGAKTLTELLEVQTGLGRAAFDSLVSEGAKLAELSVTVTGDAIAPFQVRATKAVERLMSAQVA